MIAAIFHKRGVQACRNGLQIRQAALDQAVLDVIARALDAEVISEAVPRRRGGPTSRASGPVRETDGAHG